MQTFLKFLAKDGGAKEFIFFTGRLRGQCLELKTLQDSNLFRFVLFFSKDYKNKFIRMNIWKAIGEKFGLDAAVASFFTFFKG